MAALATFSGKKKKLYREYKTKWILLEK